MVGCFFPGIYGSFGLGGGLGGLGGWERGLCGIDFFRFRSLTSYVGRWICGLHMGSHTHINLGAS